MGARLNRGNFDAAMRAAATKRAHQVGQEVVNEARARCPVDEGTLRRSIDYTVTVGPSEAKVVIGSPQAYATYFHTGTGIYGPHGTPIVPTRKRSPSGGPPYLKFLDREANKGVRLPGAMARDRDGWVYARSVKGIEKNPFLADALVAVMGNIARRRTP